MTEGIEPQTRDITEEELMSSVAQERPELLQPQEPTSQFVEPKLPYAEYQKTPLGEYNPKLTLGQIKQMADIGLKDVIYYDKTTGTTSQTPTANSIAIPLSKMGIPKQNIIRGSEPVIESKLASRDYVNSLLEKAKEPQLKEGEDITRYQFDKLASMYGKEAQAEIPQNIPSQQITDIAKMKEGISLNKSIRSQFFDLISKGKSPVDPIKGRWVDLERQWGTLSDEEVSKFTADIAQQFNTYLNNLSGAAISPDEAVRLEKRVNKAKETPAQFLGTLSSIDDEISRKISSRVETLKQSNFRVGDLEQYIIKETKPPKPKDTLPEIAKGKVKLAGGKEVEFNNGQVWKWDSVKKEAIRVK
jgi:hypothetical protein